MNVLILNASPRPKGNISRMLGVMEEEAVKAGMQVMSVRVSDLHVAPCKGCMVCRTKQACVLPEDDAQRVLQLIGACDVLVIGAPCYWGNMPGTLKVLFDRLVYGMMGESLQGIPQPLHKGKRAMLLSTCTTPFPFNVFFRQSRGTIRALREILRWSGFKISATLEVGGTKKHPVSGKTLERFRRMIRKL
ncbi:flavodoxin family protein [Bacteroides sp. An51A]|uniref:flavodoxin family protein n=1 Tax=Bacteroides sp. An51A TaxID=1965640 RepID=UPI000B385122|nr:flavodoxin family protein [Bacteroides sp. An51A]OUN80230.1 iron-sulfur protein [Bacteroides sp. An51A]